MRAAGIGIDGVVNPRWTRLSRCVVAALLVAACGADPRPVQLADSGPDAPIDRAGPVDAIHQDGGQEVAPCPPGYFDATGSGTACKLVCAAQVVPPGSLPKNLPAELRIWIKNLSSTAGDLTIQLRLTPEGQSPLTLSSQTKSLAANGDVRIVVPLDMRQHVGSSLLTLAVASSAPIPGLPCTVSQAVKVIDPPRRARPTPQAGWMEPGALSCGSDCTAPRDAAYVEALLAGLRNAGVEVVVITYVEDDQYYYPSTVVFRNAIDGRNATSWGGFDVVEATLGAADTLGVKVFLGLGRSGDMNLMGDLYACNTGGSCPTADFLGRNINTRLSDAVATDSAKAAELERLYGHHQSLYGWYLTHEANVIATARNYYDPITSYLKQSVNPVRPVLIAPAYVSSLDPGTLAGSPFDILAYQDAVGSGFDKTSLGYTYKPETRIAQLPDYYSQIRAWHDQANAGRQVGLKYVWSTSEVWEMDGTSPAPNHYGNPYPALFDRVQRQMDIESYHVDMLTMYAVEDYLEPPDSPSKLIDSHYGHPGYAYRARRLFAEVQDHWNAWKDPGRTFQYRLVATRPNLGNSVPLDMGFVGAHCPPSPGLCRVTLRARGHEVVTGNFSHVLGAAWQFLGSSGTLAYGSDANGDNEVIATAGPSCSFVDGEFVRTGTVASYANAVSDVAGIAIVALGDEAQLADDLACILEMAPQ